MSEIQTTSQTSEAPIVVDDREELLFLLCEAAELEHSLSCAYLFAAWSLKTDEGEGLTDRQLAAVRRWERAVSRVAVEEMGHLTLACNLLVSLGGAPHFARPNLPQRSRYYPQTVQLSFEPFTPATLDHFVFLERPEGLETSDAPQFVPDERAAVPWHGPDRLVPSGQQFATVGHLYRGIDAGFRRLVDRYGEDRVFLGPPRTQVARTEYDFPNIEPITDLAGAVRAITSIVEEGEGARGDWTDAHYGRFLAIRQEYRDLLAEDPEFAPARPVLCNPFVRQPFDADPVDLLSDPFTIEVSDLANAAYATMLQVLTRSFAHSSETPDQLATLADVAVTAMYRAIRPLGILLTRLPAGPNHPGANAGMTFELYRSLHLLPHRYGAWSLLHERFRTLAEHAYLLANRAPDDAATVLDRVAASFASFAGDLEAHLSTMPTTSGAALTAGESPGAKTPLGRGPTP